MSDQRGVDHGGNAGGKGRSYHGRHWPHRSWHGAGIPRSWCARGVGRFTSGYGRARSRRSWRQADLPSVVDVRDAASVRNFFAAAERALGPVDIAVANAGVFPTLAVLDMEVEEWDRVIEINLRGTFLTCQAAARSMVAGKRPGKIITISSGAHASARPGGAPCRSGSRRIRCLPIYSSRTSPRRSAIAGLTWRTRCSARSCAGWRSTGANRRWDSKGAPECTPIFS